MTSFMRQTKDGLKDCVARDSFRRAHDLLSALNSQFNSLKLLVVSGWLHSKKLEAFVAN